MLALLLSILLTAAVVVAVLVLAGRRQSTSPAEPAETAPGAPVAAGAPGAAKLRRAAANRAGHFTPYARTSGLNSPAGRRVLARAHRPDQA